MKSLKGESGYTLVELVVALVVISIIALSTLQLFTALVDSALIAKKKSIALSLATNQMEFLKSLPYDSLAVAGGGIPTTNPLPAEQTVKNSGFKYIIETSIKYVDDAFDGCADYKNEQDKKNQCRNYPPPAGVTAVDKSPYDYKIANVRVKSPAGAVLADIDSQIAARVSETESTTGTIVVKVTDNGGNPLEGATVRLTNTTVNPQIDLTLTTDVYGTVIFYKLTPDSGRDYKIEASKSGYSSLFTIPSSGSLIPMYPNVQLLQQQSTAVTMQLMPMTQKSLIIETVDTNGNPLSNLKVYLKGGYKRYTSVNDTSYYYDNMTPSDSRPISNGDGIATVDDLVPGDYYFCGDNADSNCVVGSTKYYLVAALPYSGNTPFTPTSIPPYVASSPPTMFSYSGNDYVQKVRLIFSTSSNAPRIFSIDPPEANRTSSNMNSFSYVIKGYNLPCNITASECGTTVNLLQNTNTYSANCTGTNGLQISCTSNLSSASNGWTSLQVTANSQTITMPAAPPQGGINVTQ